jgi:hypothetical protein
MKKYIILLLIMLLFIMVFAGCGGGGEPLPEPDPNLQVARKKFLDGVDDIHIGFKDAYKTSIDAIIGGAWYELPYDHKEKYAIIAADYALSYYYDKQNYYIIYFKDWRTNKEVAIYTMKANKDPWFHLKYK